ncbi:MAG: transglutaminase domain-containing protein [Oscillospiraceae bacterium]
MAKIISLVLTAVALLVFWQALPAKPLTEISQSIKHPYAAAITPQAGESRPLLSDGQKELYDVVKNGLMQSNPEILVRRFSYEEQDIQDIMWYIMQDSPEIFWVEWKWDVRSQDDGFVIIPTYNFSKEEVASKSSELEKSVSALLTLAQSEGVKSDLDKVRFVHDHLIEDCVYIEDESPALHTAYGAIVEHHTVCDGYTQAARLLLTRMGIECHYVEGTATSKNNTQGHAWNIVKVDGKYHHLDITWDDPDHMNDNNEVTNVVSYSYFLRGDEEIKLDHTIENKTPLPACEEYGYFEKVGLSGATFKDISDNLISALFENVKKDRYYIQFRITDTAEYEKIRGSFNYAMIDLVDGVNKELKKAGLDSRVYDQSCKNYPSRDTLLVVFNKDE